VISLIDVETFASWAITFVVKVMAIVRTTGEAVVTCDHEVPHGTGVIEAREIPTGVRVVLFLRTRRSERLRRLSVGPRLTTCGTPEGLDTPLRRRSP
jgi:hypothetical protein